MLNPSTADHEIIDPTVRRCINHATRWGFGEMYVVNLFAIRATNPTDMKLATDPIGKFNSMFVKEMVSSTTMTVLAFGNHASHKNRHRFVDELPKEKLFYFTKTKAGMPKHPLYIKKDAELFRWPSDEVISLKQIEELK